MNAFLKRALLKTVIVLLFFTPGCETDIENEKPVPEVGIDGEKKMKPLNEEEKEVILEKGTEQPFTGEYEKNKAKGVYLCRQCGAELYRSDDKFDSGCGWPSFDDEVEGAVKRVPDADGRRTEIICSGCDGHLGHVFLGEKYTEKNTRHCVNSISMVFKPALEAKEKTAVFASGCFWGTEFHFNKAPGVVSAVSGYTGGSVDNPTYKQVCDGNTGHQEAVQVKFDPAKTSFEDLAKLYFETHDFTQTDGQGPDIGEQYLSVIFYTNEEQKEIAEKLIKILEEKGHKVATKLLQAKEFWPAEDHHQDYYEKKGTKPYCHLYKKVF